MIDGKFDVVFRGQITKNFEIDQVKQNLVKLFKSTPEGVEKLFSGAEVVIRKDLDYTQAMKYQSALKNAGALALIKEIENAEPATSPVTTEPEVVEQVTDQQSDNSQSGNPQSDNPDNDGDFDLANPGERILPDKVYEKRDVNTEHLSVGQVGDRLLPEKPPEEYAQPSIDHLSLEDPK